LSSTLLVHDFQDGKPIKRTPLWVVARSPRFRGGRLRDEATPRASRLSSGDCCRGFAPRNIHDFFRIPPEFSSFCASALKLFNGKNWISYAIKIGRAMPADSYGRYLNGDHGPPYE